MVVVVVRASAAEALGGGEVRRGGGGKQGACCFYGPGKRQGMLAARRRLHLWIGARRESVTSDALLPVCRGCFAGREAGSVAWLSSDSMAPRPCLACIGHCAHPPTDTHTGTRKDSKCARGRCVSNPCPFPLATHHHHSPPAAAKRQRRPSKASITRPPQCPWPSSKANAAERNTTATSTARQWRRKRPCCSMVAGSTLSFNWGRS